jgi:hypothetical protein
MQSYANLNLLNRGTTSLKIIHGQFFENMFTHECIY